MEKNPRTLELLSYAAECFRKCTSPFETVHLVKKQVSSTECIDLSQGIAETIDDFLFTYYKREEIEAANQKAKEDFAATQED